MKINLTDSINRNYYNNSKISYKGSSSVSKLKNIEGNFCACCGKETIKSRQLSQMWSKITLPLSKLIKNNVYEKVWRVSPEIFSTLFAFANKYPEKSLAQIVTDNDAHNKFLRSVEAFLINSTDYNKCPNFVKDQMKKDKTMEILKISEIDLKPAPEVIENVKPYRKYMHDYRGDIFDELETLSKKYPDKKLSEILKIREVYEHYIEATYYDAMDFAKNRDYHLNNANNIILENSPETKTELDKIYTGICDIYTKERDGKRITYLIKSLYKNLINQYNLSDIENSVMQELAQMPVNLYTKNSFLSYARMYYNDGAIVNYMVKPFMETIEHIVPISRGGQNSIDNVVMFCRQCNNNRAWHPYSEFVQYHPEMLENGPRQAKFYDEGISLGEITSDLRDYPVKVSKTLDMAINGVIDFDISDDIQKSTEKGNILFENEDD